MVLVPFRGVFQFAEVSQFLFNAAMATSSRLPVTSLRYRAMKGTVPPSSSSWMVATRLLSGIFSNAAMWMRMRVGHGARLDIQGKFP